MSWTERPRLITETRRAPGSRFPWVQLVFCAACLGMAAWTWMRYSYCWEIGDEELGVDEEDLFVEARLSDPNAKVYLTVIRRECALGFPSRYLVQAQHGESFPEVFVTQEAAHRLVSFRETEEDMLFDIPATRLASPPGHLRGRIWRDGNYIYLDAGRGRFAGQSVAGMAVGAMGAFIFALYLRRWVRERGAIPATENAEHAGDNVTP